MRRTRSITVIAALSIVVALPACTAPVDGGVMMVRPDVTITPGAATLDPINVQIQEPLDAFSPSIDEQRQIARARDLYMVDCAASKGSTISLPNVYDYAVSPNYNFRYFGVWTLNVATRYGHGIPSDPLKAANDAADAEIPEDVYMEIIACLQEPAAQAYMLPVEQGESVAERGFQESWAWAETDPAVQASFDAYRTCMTPKGYTFDDAYSHYSPVSVDPNNTGTESDIVSAVDEVNCKTQAQLPQTFADAAHAYQLDFIEDNQAALAEERKKFEDQLAATADFIAKHPKGS